MIRFKQKNYTLQEGHYTGPKDMEKVPGTVEMIGKAVLGGSAIGAAAGGIIKETGLSKETGIFDGLKRGGKIGFVSGILLKLLTNHLHKPMKKIKFQEVDKLIRREFGIYRFSGFTTGDSREKRKTFDEKFKLNDRNVTDYKLTFCINNNQVSMYTLGLSSEELEKVNNSIDYYCKKYYGMEYSSRPINSRTNTYSVNITFTNYEAISSFILELSEELGCKINLMDSNALAETRIGAEGKESVDEEEQRIYSSLPVFSKFDIMQILMPKSAMSAKSIFMSFNMGPVSGLSELIQSMAKSAIMKLSDREIAKANPLWNKLAAQRKMFDNHYLEDRLKKLGYIEGMHYTVGKESSELNISLNRGILVVTALSGSKNSLLLEKILPDSYKKTEVSGKVSMWTGTFNSRNEFDVLLKKIIGTVKPNIYIQ